MVSLLWVSIVLTLGGCIWEAVHSAKISCKSCKKFEESFKKVSCLNKWRGRGHKLDDSSGLMPLPILTMLEETPVGKKKT